MPIDTLYPYKVVEGDVVGSGGNDTSIGGKIISFFLQSYLHNMFTCGFDEHDMLVSKDWFLNILPCWVLSHNMLDINSDEYLRQ